MIGGAKEIDLGAEESFTKITFIFGQLRVQGRIAIEKFAIRAGEGPLIWIFSEGEML
jgi:hypothetical protein